MAESQQTLPEAQPRTRPSRFRVGAIATLAAAAAPLMAISSDAPQATPRPAATETTPAPERVLVDLQGQVAEIRAKSPDLAVDILAYDAWVARQVTSPTNNVTTKIQLVGGDPDERRSRNETIVRDYRGLVGATQLEVFRTAAEQALNCQIATAAGGAIGISPETDTDPTTRQLQQAYADDVELVAAAREGDDQGTFSDLCNERRAIVETLGAALLADNPDVADRLTHGSQPLPMSPPLAGE